MIDGVEFEVWHAPDWGDASGANPHRWRYIAYRSVAPRLTATLNIRRFLDDAIARGLVDP